MSRKVFITFSSSEARRVRVLAQDTQGLGHFSLVRSRALGRPALVGVWAPATR